MSAFFVIAMHDFGIVSTFTQRNSKDPVEFIESHAIYPSLLKNFTILKTVNLLWLFVVMKNSNIITAGNSDNIVAL